MYTQNRDFEFVNFHTCKLCRQVIRFNVQLLVLPKESAISEKKTRNFAVFLQFEMLDFASPGLFSALFFESAVPGSFAAWGEPIFRISLFLLSHLSWAASLPGETSFSEFSCFFSQLSRAASLPGENPWLLRAVDGGLSLFLPALRYSWLLLASSTLPVYCCPGANKN